MSPRDESRDQTDPVAEEKVLVDRMLAGDERAFDEFADAYVPGVYRFALNRLGQDRELAQEIVQTTMCKTIAKLDSFRGEARLLTWLCACCRNEIAGHFRRQATRPREEELDEAIQANHLSGVTGGAVTTGVVGPEACSMRRQEKELVHLALDHLPQRYACALEWKYFDGLSVKQIAWRLKLGPKAAESLLSRARQAFRASYTHLTGEADPVLADVDARKQRGVCES